MPLVIAFNNKCFKKLTISSLIEFENYLINNDGAIMEKFYLKFTYFKVLLSNLVC